MPKVGINVGEDFPAEEVNSPQHDESERCRDREEWRRRHEEWHRRGRAFADDVRSAARRHFGGHSFLAHNVFVLRALFAVAVIVLLIALLPHMLLLGIALTTLVFVMLERHRFRRHRFGSPHGEV